MAIEYAYRYHQAYQVALWARADTTEALNSSYTEIAGLLELPQKGAQEQEVIVQAVKGWLSSKHDWLLILDNADDLPIVQAFLPTRYTGHLLLTTRAQATGTVAQPLEIETMDEETGTLFLLRRARLVAPDALLENASPADRAVASQITKELGGLPLALDQAGAYIEETACSLADYQRLYQTRRADLLRTRGTFGDDHPQPVATTWSLSFEQVEQRNPAAADLLRLCAFLAPDAIPEEILIDGAAELGPTLASIATDAFYLNEAIAVLRAYSLLVRDPQAKTLGVHRLVQTVVGEALSIETQRQWKQRTVLALNAAFPSGKFTNWPICERLLPHALYCAAWIEQEQLEIPEGTRLLNQAGHYLIERGRYEEAEPLLKLALAMMEQQLGAEHVGITAYLNNLATLHEMRGRYEEAELLLKRALTIKEQQLGVEHLSTLGSLSNLALLYQRQGRYEKAEPLFERVLVAREKQLGAEHPDTAASLNNLASLYVKQRRYAEAEPLFERALAIKEQQLGTEHPDTVGSLNSLAVVYQEQGRYAEAESLFERTLAIRERLLGTEHPDTALSMNNLAVLYVRQGRYAEAEPLFKRVLAIREQQWGVTHPSTASSLSNLAGLYVSQGKYDEAEPLYKRALAIFEQLLGAEHTNTASILNNLAYLYMRQGKYVQAEPLLVRVLALRERELGAMHPDTAISLSNLASLYADQGRYAEAEPLLVRVLALRERELGSEHPSTATSLSNLASLYADQGRYAEAEPLYQRALLISEQKLGSEHPDTITIRHNLVSLQPES